MSMTGPHDKSSMNANLVDSFCQQILYLLANLMFPENGKTDACLRISCTKFVIWNISGHSDNMPCRNA
jgi:hypothetical protein